MEPTRHDNRGFAPKTQAYNPNPQGYGPQNNGNNNNRKTLIYIIIGLLALLVVAVGFLFKGIYNRNMKEKHEAERIEKMRQDSIAERMRQDSLMLYFSAPDLTVFQAKGYVKEITMTVSNQYSSSIYTFSFSPTGVLTSGTCTSQGNVMNITIKKRNEAIRDFVIKYNSKIDEYESYTDSYSFVYNKDLNVSSITNNYENCGGAVKTTYSFSQFDGMNLPSVISEKVESYAHGCESKGSGTLTIKYNDFDQKQNWTSAIWSGTIKTRAYFYGDDTGSSDSYNNNISITRVIQYYDRMEIFGVQ